MVSLSKLLKWWRSGRSCIWSSYECKMKRLHIVFLIRQKIYLKCYHVSSQLRFGCLTDHFLEFISDKIGLFFLFVRAFLHLTSREHSTCMRANEFSMVYWYDRIMLLTNNLKYLDVSHGMLPFPFLIKQYCHCLMTFLMLQNHRECQASLERNLGLLLVRVFKPLFSTM